MRSARKSDATIGDFFPESSFFRKRFSLASDRKEQQEITTSQRTQKKKNGTCIFLRLRVVDNNVRIAPEIFGADSLSGNQSFERHNASARQRRALERASPRSGPAATGARRARGRSRNPRVSRGGIVRGGARGPPDRTGRPLPLGYLSGHQMDFAQ